MQPRVTRSPHLMYGGNQITNSRRSRTTASHIQMSTLVSIPTSHLRHNESESNVVRRRSLPALLVRVCTRRRRGLLYIVWKIGSRTMFMMDGRAIGPTGNIQARQISEEPMSIVLNLGFSHAWTEITWDKLVFPTVMRIDCGIRRRGNIQLRVIRLGSRRQNISRII